jgi:hypothetical protein
MRYSVPYGFVDGDHVAAMTRSVPHGWLTHLTCWAKICEVLRSSGDLPERHFTASAGRERDNVADPQLPLTQ